MKELFDIGYEPQGDLKEQLMEADKQIAMLFKIIDEDNNNLRYCQIIDQIYDAPAEEHRQIIPNMLSESNERDIQYRQYVKQLARELQAQSDEKVLQVSELIYKIRSEFFYDLEDRDMLGFVEGKKGKCWHISIFFQDVCRRLGLPCETVKGWAENGLHVWNRMRMAGCVMYFDVTWYMTSGDTKFIWASKEDFHAHRDLV